MSLFRKPTKKIQRRVFGASQDDDEDGDPEAPPPPIISKQKKENKPAKIKTLLSFADEEEDDGEVFKVKKSSQSKRLIKKREKEKKNAGESKYENNIPEDKPQQEAHNTQQAPGKKKVTLEGLILSGREALAADGAGDVSDDEPVQEEEEEEESRGFHRYRAETVRAVLAAGVDGIPDAALIHAARKTRQQARELGGGDYIPIRPDNDCSGPGSRLVRDDGSGDDEEGIMHVRGLELPSDKPKRGTAAAPTDAEVDSAGEEWEEQQMQKAIDLTGDDLNPFSLVPAPPPPRLEDGPPHLRALLPAPAAPGELRDALRVRLQELQISRDAVSRRAEELAARLLSASRTRESRAARAAPLDAAYKRAQAARAYLTDLLECADEKMPALCALESRALALHRRRCEFVQERRRADVRDETQDVLALAARPGAVRAPDPPDKVRRAAERAGRRRARRSSRAAAGAGAASHRDGDSSDDELEPDLHTHLQREREEIRQLSASLFADALPAWRSVRGVCSRMSRWRRREPRLYKDAYVADCLPRLVAPYVRHQLILWNPLADEDNEDYERMDWYKCLMMYGVRSERLTSDSEDSSSGADSATEGSGARQVTERAVREDVDLMLVPTVMRCVVLPKLTELVQHAWDPMSVRACVRLRGLLVRLAALPPRGCPRLQRLAAVATARLAQATQQDVLLPALPQQIMDGGGSVFWRRCLGAGVRLLRAVLALCAPPAALHAERTALQLIGALCCAAAAAPPASAAAAAAALASTVPGAGAGQLRLHALRLVAKLAAAAAGRLDAANPMHLKALEQTRSVLAQARACDSCEASDSR